MSRLILLMGVVVLFAAPGCNGEGSSTTEGEIGPQGLQGDPGTAGADGVDGVDGVQGPQGLQGIPGTAGVDGVDGVNGVDGLPGPQGIQGVPGTAGVDGVDGVDGVNGATGPQGLQGDPGTAGVDGADGADGSDGLPGPQGAAGPAGPPGSVWGEPAAVFAGFTAGSYDGNQSGHSGMNAVCDSEFAGSHFCHVSEYLLCNSATPAPALGAWVADSCGVSGFGTEVTLMGNRLAGKSISVSTYRNCYNWTHNDATYTGNAITTERTTYTGKNCDVPRPLACCSTPYLEIFSGFTSTSYTGDMGGQAGAHFLCGLDFPGSHMCHMAEYYRANTTTLPPADGAWIDKSTGFKMGSGGTFTTTVCASSELGRSIACSTYNNCYNWTTNDNTYSGNTVTELNVNYTGKNCDTPRPIACCE